jgi:SAM-dependent methyltransferase
LTGLGYEVVGVDGDPKVSPALVPDLRGLDSLPSDFDAVVNLWASFGYFDEATNEHVLTSFGRRLRPGGRLVLDLFNRAFFDGRPAEAVRELRPGVFERSRLVGARRQVELDYGDGHVDRFEWQLYRPEELAALALDSGWCSSKPRTTRQPCSSSSSATPSHP